MAAKRTLNVEASSLSTVTDIASNPPAHPGVPVDGPLQPLTLYIAKVPGSQDVFLTPLKPRDKVVTAEDVLSALYYVHINTDEDQRFVEEEPSASPSLTNNPLQLTPTGEGSVQRKPLPPPRSPKPADLPTPPGSESEYFPPFPQRKPVKPQRPHNDTRKPLVAEGPNGRIPYAPDLDLPDIPRRRLPSPLAETPPYGSSLYERNVHSLQLSDHSDESNPYLRNHRQSESDLPSPMAEHSPPASPSAPMPGTLTLIRRDPGSTEQWNVATIHDPPVHEVSSASLLSPTSASGRTKRGGAPMFLDVTNPGYLQFIDLERPVSRNSTSTRSSADDPPPAGTFRRRMYMPGSAYGEHGYSSSASRPSMSPSSGASFDMPRSLRLSAQELATASSIPPRFDRRSKNYTFPSPYPGGQCTFHTSSSGRSLKCRHAFPSIPTSSQQELSELRFNLPIDQPQQTQNQQPPQQQQPQHRQPWKPSHSHSISYSGPPSTTPSPITATALKRKSLALGRRGREALSELNSGPNSPSAVRKSTNTNNTNSNDNNDDDVVGGAEERMDLSLGQESAGGGLGGKQAKLGKLIIEVEGLRMLDLLVAANVGLWWRAYGRGRE